MRLLQRKGLTDLVLSTLRAQNFHVGDVNPPDYKISSMQAGWNGQPGLPGSTFLPYGVLTPLTATITSGPMKDPQGDIRLPYQLSVYGLDRAQVELLMDKFRIALDVLRNQHITLNTQDHKIQQVNWTTMGGVVRADSTDPATMGEIDIFTVWMTRSVA